MIIKKSFHEQGQRSKPMSLGWALITSALHSIASGVVWSRLTVVHYPTLPIALFRVCLYMDRIPGSDGGGVIG